MSHNPIVIYTAIFGGYDGLLPQKKIKGVDFVCFSDRPLRAKPWEVRIVEPNFVDPVRSAKEYKILPHHYFPDYNYSVWIDGNFLAIGDIPALIDMALKDCGMAFFSHNATTADPRNCLYKEFKSIMQLGKETGEYKDDPEMMRRQVSRYREEGYPPDSGLISGGVLLRRHHSPDVVKCMDRWWLEITFGSRRDQLSFNYVAWKEHFRPYIIEGNIRDNPWFHMIGIHRSDYRWKLLRYRLRRLFRLRYGGGHP